MQPQQEKESPIATAPSQTANQTTASPAIPAAAPEHIEAPHPPRKSHKKLAIFLIVWPIVLIPLLIVLNLAISQLLPGSPPSSDDLFGEPSAAKRAIDILTFLGGAINFLAGLPSFIIGIIMLVNASGTGKTGA